MANLDAYKAEIRRTFDLVKPISTEAAEIFYPTLWEVNPATKALFKNTDMVKQGEMLMKTLGVAVTMLDSMDKLVPILQNLGRRHVSYGVTAEMYPSVGEALLMTLDKGLGEECTPETKVAWTWVLGAISAICIEGAKAVDPGYGEMEEGGGGGVKVPVETAPSEPETSSKTVASSAVEASVMVLEPEPEPEASSETFAGKKDKLEHVVETPHVVEAK